MSGSDQADSIDARLGSPLIAHVSYADGTPFVGVAVRFSVVANAAESIGLKLLPLPTSVPDSVAVVQTDATGRASVFVANQTRVGLFNVVITASGVTGQATASLTVTPGRAHAITIGTKDTLLYVGRSFAPAFSVADRLGNNRSVVMTSSTTNCMIETNQVIGVTVGRCSIILSAAPLLDSLHVSVIPMLSVLAIRNEYDPLKTPQLVSMGLDGTGYVELAPLSYQFPAELLLPLWVPDHRRITLHAGMGPYSTRLTIFDSSMTPRTFMMQGVTSVQENWGRFSADGQWLYFSSRATTGEPFAVWRARPDGSQAERITPLGPGLGFNSNYADVTPDGKTVVYADHSLHLNAIDVATRAVRPLTTPAGAPIQAYQIRISPDGRSIAFVYPLSGRFGMHIINLDGTGYRLLSNDFGYDVGDVPFDWTPDGKWILTRRHEFVGDATGGLIFFREWVLLNAESAAYVPLPYKSFTPTSMMIER